MIAAGYSTRHGRERDSEKPVALIAVITLVILVLIAVGIYVIAFVILSPMIR
jgi:hypothetical protein